MNTAKQTFVIALQNAIGQDSFIRLTLSAPQGRGVEPDLQKIIVRQVLLKSGRHLSLTYRYKTRDIVKNYPYDQFYALLPTLLAPTAGFSYALLCTDTQDYAYPSLKTTQPSLKKEENQGHDRVKNRMIDPATKPFLQDLKVTDSKGQILKSAHDKFRQIDKYLEILASLLRQADLKAPPHVFDMGSGKGYLTFALYDYLTQLWPQGVQAHGIEYRADMVDLCNKIARKNDLSGLSFTKGSIEDADVRGCDILIALHACDTATDDALAAGVFAGAKIIVAAPCCHKQVRRQMEASGSVPDLNFMIRHGIYTERMAEMVTDSLRAMLLEAAGYEVKVFEFISGEHTAKNIMITAVKSEKAITKEKRHTIIDQYARTKDLFHIQSIALEKILDL